MPDFSSLRASNDRIGWLTAGNEYIEFSLDGREISRFDGPPMTEKHRGQVTFALSNDNQVVVVAQSADRWDVWVLDRRQRMWNPMETSGEALGTWGQLLGFDEDTLVIGFGFTGGQVHRYKRDSASKGTEASQFR